MCGDAHFWVVASDRLRAQAVRSVGIAGVRRNAAGPILYQELAAAI
jgi:hypothetical protein